jgi:hypothetical protein
MFLFTFWVKRIGNYSLLHKVGKYNLTLLLLLLFDMSADFLPWRRGISAVKVHSDSFEWRSKWTFTNSQLFTIEKETWCIHAMAGVFQIWEQWPEVCCVCTIFLQSVIICALCFSLLFHMVRSRMSAIEQHFSCMLILGYRIVKILFGIRTCFVIWSPLNSVIKTMVQKWEAKRTLQTQQRGDWLSVLVTWCSMCGSSFWLYTWKVVILPVAGDWQVAFIVSVSQGKKVLTNTILLLCTNSQLMTCKQELPAASCFKHLLPKIQTSYLCCGF